MTSTSREPRAAVGAAVLRGADARQARAAQLDDLVLGTPVTATPGMHRSFAEVVEDARAAARQEGYAAGHAEGLAAAQDEITRRERVREEAAAADREAFAVRTGRALAALRGAADDLAARRVAETEALLALVLDTALELAEALVGHDLAVRGTPVLDAVHRALSVVPPATPVVVRLHPDDAATLGTTGEVAGHEVRVVADPAVPSGGCVAEAGSMRVDADLRAAVDRARRELGR